MTPLAGVPSDDTIEPVTCGAGHARLGDRNAAALPS